MATTDETAGYCKGLARVLEKLGVIKKITAKEPGKRQGYWQGHGVTERVWCWHPMRYVYLGKAQPPAKYQLTHDTTTLEALLAACRVAPTAPGGADVATLGLPVRTQADLIRHMEALRSFLATWPQELQVRPPLEGKKKFWGEKRKASNITGT